MRGSSVLLSLALVACGTEGKPAAAPTTTPPTTPPPSPSSAAVMVDDVAAALKDVAVAEEAYFSDNATYTTDLSKLLDEDLVPRAGVTVRVVSASRSAYCLKASASVATLYYTTATGQISATACH